MIAHEESHVGAEVRITRRLNAPVERAFRTFTERGDDWWPRAYHLGRSERANLILEPHEGGRWYERGDDGTECDWGRVLVWEPPHRLVLSWQIGVGFVPEPDPGRASRVEIRFAQDGPGQSTITLIHSDFEKHGSGWESMRDSVAGEGGWPHILDQYAGQVETRDSDGGGTCSDANPKTDRTETDSNAPVLVRVVRQFDAAPERVFDAWLDAEMLGRWMFGPGVRDEEIVHLTLDPRLGGTFSFLVRRDSEEMDHVGTYLEIERPRRLAFTWGIAGESDEESRVVIDIIQRGDGCELTLVHELDPKWAGYVSQTETGWSLMLEKLAGVLATAGGR